MRSPASPSLCRNQCAVPPGLDLFTFLPGTYVPGFPMSPLRGWNSGVFHFLVVLGVATLTRGAVSPPSSFLWTVGSIVAIGTGRTGRDGGNLIGDAADWGGAAIGAVALQFLDDLFVAARAIVASEARQGLGQNVVVVHVLHTRFPGHVEAQAMKLDDVLVLHGGRVWADAEGVDGAIGLNDL